MTTANNSNPLSHNEVLATIKKYRVALLSLTILGALGGVVSTYLAKPVNEVKSVLIIPISLPSAGELGDLFGVGKANPVEILQGMLESRSITKVLASKFGIREKEISQYYSVEVDTKKNQLAINTRMAGSEHPIAMNQLAIDTLTQVTRSVNRNKGEKLASQIKTLKDKAEQSLREAQQKVLSYQLGVKSAPDPRNPTASDALKLIRETEYQLEQAKQQLELARKQAETYSKVGLTLPTALPPVTQMRDKIVQLELQIKIAKVQFGDSHPQVERLLQELQVTKSQVNEEIANYLKASGSNLDARTAEILGRKMLLEWQLKYLKDIYKVAPKESLDLTNLTAELQLKTTLFTDLAQKYERARVEELVDPIQWTTLVPPYITPDSPINKRWIRTPITWATLSFLAFSTLFFFIDIRKKR